MTILKEGGLELELPPGVIGIKFDDTSHGLSHCMKAVDFIIEEPDKTLFIEFKDPDDPRANPASRTKFISELKIGKKDDALIQKYRDSFIYRWAEDKVQKPVLYLILIATSQLDEAMLLARCEELKRRLPAKGPPSGRWKKQLVHDCMICNIDTWNKHLSRYPIRRISVP